MQVLSNCYNKELNPVSNSLRPNFLTFIIKIYILTIIAFTNNTKTILKFPRSIDLTKSFLLPYFFPERWFINDTNINIVPKLKT